MLWYIFSLRREVKQCSVHPHFSQSGCKPLPGHAGYCSLLVLQLSLLVDQKGWPVWQKQDKIEKTVLTIARSHEKSHINNVSHF